MLKHIEDNLKLIAEGLAELQRASMRAGFAPTRVANGSRRAQPGSASAPKCPTANSDVGDAIVQTGAGQSAVRNVGMGWRLWYCRQSNETSFNQLVG